MEKNTIVGEHIQKDVIIEYAFYPKHGERHESNMFKRSKERLKKDGHYKCFICGCTDKLESHHIFEWAFEESLDLDVVKEALKTFDFYGYSKEMIDKPLENLDDVRNQLVLCENHHRHQLTGIHHLSFPLWISQKADKVGCETVPQSEEDLKKKQSELHYKER